VLVPVDLRADARTPAVLLARLVGVLVGVLLAVLVAVLVGVLVGVLGLAEAGATMAVGLAGCEPSFMRTGLPPQISSRL